MPRFPTSERKTVLLARDERAYNHALSRFSRARRAHLRKLKAFRMLSDQIPLSKTRLCRKFAIIAGIVNLAAGFEPSSANPRCRQLKIYLLSQQVY